jgi:hypothetical protein
VSTERGQGFGPSILDGDLRYTSVSQLEKFDHESYGGCERRWWFRYVDGKPEPTFKAQKLGTQVHAQIEHYLRTGEDVLGELARAGRRFLPAPIPTAPGLEVELAVGALREHLPGGTHGPVDSLLDCAGVPVIGFVDALDFRDVHANDQGEMVVEQNVVEVVDWKTTKRIDDEVDPDTGIVTARGFAKSAEALAKSHQMVGYAELARRRFPKATAIRVSHGYFQTTGRREATKRSELIPVDEVRARWRRSEAVVERMRATAKIERAEDVAENLKSCSAYGGCPYKPTCPRNPKAVLAELLGGGKAMSLLDKMRAKREEPTAKPEVAAEMESLKAEEKAIKAGITPPDMPKPDKIAEPLPAGSPEAVALAKAKAGTLKDAGNGQVYDRDGADTGHILRPATPTESAALAECESGKQVKLDVKAAVSKKYACSCGEVVKVKPQEMPDGTYHALVPKHRITVKFEEEAPKVAEPAIASAPVSITTTLEVSPHSNPEVAYQLKSTVDEKPGLSLYLDCHEDGVHAKRLEPYVEKLCRELEKQVGAADIRCAPEKSELAFGRWKGALAAFARSAPPEPGAYEVSSGSEVAMVVFEALASTARRVVRG